MLERGNTDAGLRSLVGQLVEDTRGLAKAEIALAKARLGDRVGAYKSAIMFFVVAGVLALAALIALLVGLIETLATLVGPGFATAIVVGVTLAIAVALAIVGKGKLTKSAPEVRP